MVGMSGKASEPRRGHATQQKKSSAGHAGLGKTQPPPEALHVANILGDGVYPADLPDKMAQVMAMLPSCAEEEVCIALHDHDFDTERAITALLDRDLLSGSQVNPSLTLFTHSLSLTVTVTLTLTHSLSLSHYSLSLSLSLSDSDGCRESG